MLGSLPYVFLHPPMYVFVCLLHYQMADKSQSGTLEDDEFVLFYKMLTQREDVLRVFQEYSVDGQKLSQRDLEDFLREEQLEDGNIEQEAKQLIERYEPSDTGTYAQDRKIQYVILIYDFHIGKKKYIHRIVWSQFNNFIINNKCG